MEEDKDKEETEGDSHLQAKGCPRLPEAGRDGTVLPPPEGKWPCQHRGFELPAS